MIARTLLNTVRQRLRTTSAVVLLGPRQVGKTTLARALAAEWGSRALYLDLEREADRRRLDDADSYLRAQAGRLVILDEIHRAPALFPLLRGIIDERRAAGERAGHFLLLGSASLDLQQQAGESLAGRVAYLEMTPILARELATHDAGVPDLWVRGGFPGSLLAANGADSMTWRQDFVRSYLERDVPMFAPRMPAELIGRLWRMLAHAQGTPVNKARLAASLEVSSPAIGRYVDLLTDLLLVRRLPPWSGNLGKRLVRAPKLYVRDSGLLHALLAIESLDDVLSHPVVGASWEGFVIEQLIAAAGSDRLPLYFRTEKGAEVDLLFERGGRVEMLIEIKRTAAPTVSRGLRSAAADLDAAAVHVVHGGSESWPMGGGVTATSLAGLVEYLSATAR
ncbi:ATP-binding protein [Gemmatimonas sp.]|uniref:ATP-binding protein n=1 Tax=Gemmatimonas sp. TaxID=1962908 RepID=UPI0035659B99